MACRVVSAPPELDLDITYVLAVFAFDPAPAGCTASTEDAQSTREADGWSGIGLCST